MEPEGSLPHSQAPATCPFPLHVLYQRISPSSRPCEMLHNIVTFYGEELLALRQTPKLEDHPLSAIPNYLFSIVIDQQ
jgi:hypothetical protein